MYVRLSGDPGAGEGDREGTKKQGGNILGCRTMK
jgi:hypothetical protein